MFNSPEPVVIDLAGVKVKGQLTAYLDDNRVGHSVEVVNDGTTLEVKGILSGGTGKVDEIVGSTRNGFPWELTIKAKLENIERLRRGDSAEVNGQTVQGPVNIARAATLTAFVFDVYSDDENQVLIHEKE